MTIRANRLGHHRLTKEQRELLKIGPNWAGLWAGSCPHSECTYEAVATDYFMPQASLALHLFEHMADSHGDYAKGESPLAAIAEPEAPAPRPIDPRSYPLPAPLLAKLKAYVDDRRPVGGFLEACISNNLAGAVARADSVNISLIPAIMTWLHNEAAPAFCWGSPERYAHWTKSRPSAPFCEGTGRPPVATDIRGYGTCPSCGFTRALGGELGSPVMAAHLMPRTEVLG